jgi:hypothetical protein
MALAALGIGLMAALSAQQAARRPPLPPPLEISAVGLRDGPEPDEFYAWAEVSGFRLERSRNPRCHTTTPVVVFDHAGRGPDHLADVHVEPPEAVLALLRTWQAQYGGRAPV